MSLIKELTEAAKEPTKVQLKKFHDRFENVMNTYSREHKNLSPKDTKSMDRSVNGLYNSIERDESFEEIMQKLDKFEAKLKKLVAKNKTTVTEDIQSKAEVWYKLDALAKKAAKDITGHAEQAYKSKDAQDLYNSPKGIALEYLEYFTDEVKRIIRGS